MFNLGEANDCRTIKLVDVYIKLKTRNNAYNNWRQIRKQRKKLKSHSMSQLYD